MLLLEPNRPSVDDLFKKFWIHIIPSKVLAFGWQVLMDRAPSRMNLWKRNIIEDVEGLNCVFCEAGLETLDHLLFGCCRSLLLWKSVYRWTGFEVVLPAATKQHYLNHRGMVRGKELKKLWMVIWFATTWSIWLSRNAVIFNQEPFDESKQLEIIKPRVWNWFKFRGKGSNHCFSDWCIAPIPCMMSCD